MKIKIFLMLVMSVVTHDLLAQKISFEKSTKDFGTTLWRRPVTTVFHFENKHSEPLVVDSVYAGCGCMDVKWAQGQLPKGGKGEISITYDAMLIGRFDRIINVYINGIENPERIRLKGKVLYEIDEDFQNLFPYKIGDIWLSTDNIEFPDVHKGDSAVASFEVFNNSSEVYTPQLMHLPSYITAEYIPAMLGRRKRGVVSLKLNSDKMDNVGINQTNIYLARYSGDRVSVDNDIVVTSVLLPQLEKSSNYLLNPRFYISSNVIDIGKLGRKSKLSGKVTITNTGTGVLKIESIAVYNKALTVSLPKRSLLPGESMKMKVTLRAKYLDSYNSHLRVFMITNDAEHQKETITVRFEK